MSGCHALCPHYPSGKRGRPPIAIDIILRIYLLQCRFTLSDEGVEDAIYDIYSMRKFMGINFLAMDVPDATTLLKFRPLLEKYALFFDAINRCLKSAGRMMCGGIIADATLISAFRSTKNTKKECDPEMHQTKKGNQWHFGMKCHTGVDAGSGFVHTVEMTAANVHDITVATKLLRENAEVVYGDSAYLGIEKREELQNNA
ncbi:MAG TPA: IS5 family transposase [Candidatus Agathobaculum intestinipullorum]|nr:IS5 family transposase [Candidatus Agathobaculum intestinipullorum]